MIAGSRQTVCVSRRIFLDQATRRLHEAGIEEARKEARSLIEAVAGISIAHQLAFPDVLLSVDQLVMLGDALAMREARVPLSQIVGEASFYNLTFKVTKDTLTPRPESELLVDMAIEYAQALSSICLLDVFTGTGAIGISVARCLSDIGKDVVLVMTDNSQHAIDVARQNARRLISTVDWTLERTDIWPSTCRPYDVITANPPYIATDEIATLMPEVKRFEPLSALDGGKDGLSFYRRLAREAGRFLSDDGVLIIEIGASQEEDVLSLFLNDRAWREHGRKNDLAGYTRLLSFHKVTE